jgi:hypothetical protein
LTRGAEKEGRKEAKKQTEKEEKRECNRKEKQIRCLFLSLIRTGAAAAAAPKEMSPN